MIYCMIRNMMVFISDGKFRIRIICQIAIVNSFYSEFGSLAKIIVKDFLGLLLILFS